MKRKGFTLIEMIIAMAIVSLMIGAIGSILISYTKLYKNSVVQNKSFNYLNEAICLIEKEINQEAEQIEINDNIIKINYSDNTVNYIKRINSNIFLIHATDLIHKNIIIDDIKDFVAVRYNNMIYLKIVWNNGDAIERCLGIENAN